jgi:hypothetical protein
MYLPVVKKFASASTQKSKNMPRTILLEPVGNGLDTSTCAAYTAEPMACLFPNRGCPYAANSPEFERAIITALEAIDYDPGADYIVVAGRLSKVCMFVATVCNYYTPTRLLVYDERQRKYVVQMLTEHIFTPTGE